MPKTIAAALVSLAVGVAVFVGLYKLFNSSPTPIGNEINLPLLALAGIVALLVVLACTSISFGLFGLSDKTQALALPDGSIRAVIALSLVVLFAILSVSLYEGIKNGGPVQRRQFTTEQARADFQKNNPNISDVDVSSEKTDAGAPPAAEAAKLAVTYLLKYRNPSNPSSDEFAKQLLVMIGTLLTAMTSFYFGAKTAAGAATTAAAPPPPLLRSLARPSGALSEAAFDLEIRGENLNSIKQVKLGKDNKAIEATEVVSNDLTVKCKVNLTNAAPGNWDVLAVDGSGKIAKLPAAFTVT